jgi:hypothetical protein
MFDRPSTDHQREGMNMQTNHTTDVLELKSMYQNQVTLKAHAISLSLGEESGGSRKGVLRLDPNLCAINAWGDVTTTTKMGVHGVEVVVTRMRTLDPSGHRRVMHQVHGPGFQPGELNLIEFPEAHLWYLVDHRKDGAYVVPLFPAELVTPSSAGIIAARYGVAIRAAIEHGDVEEMRAEAERVREALAGWEDAQRRAASIESANVNEVREALTELQAALAKLES